MVCQTSRGRARAEHGACSRERRAGQSRGTLAKEVIGAAVRLSSGVQGPSRVGGFTVLELVLVMALVSLMAAAALAKLGTGLQSRRTAAAARYLEMEFRLARSTAVRDSVAVGVGLSEVSGFPFLASYSDGDGDGVRADDVTSGVDPTMRPWFALQDQFPGVTFGFVGEVPGIEGGARLTPGADPIRFGTSDIVVFTPLGSATSGTVYLRDAQGTQFAVRVLGATGRVRLLEYMSGSRTWELR